MKPLRSYIARWLATLLVCTGFSLYMVQPAQAAGTPDAFARWLSMMAERSEAPALIKELEDLRSSGGQLADMLEHASQIICNNNNEECDFSFAGEQVSGELYRFLLIEWNQFQTGNAMAGTPVPQTVKPLLLLDVNKAADITFAPAGPPGCSRLSGADSIAAICQVTPPMLVEPMSGGMAIGAP